MGPNGTDHCCNALRLAGTLLKKAEGDIVTMFLFADAVVAAKAGQTTRESYYKHRTHAEAGACRKGEVL